MPEAQTLVLDIGGIFFYPAWRTEGVAATATIIGVSEQDLMQALKKDKRLFYTGVISEVEYWNGVLRALTTKEIISSDKMARTYRSYVRPIPETLNLLPQLSARYSLCACNNSPKEWMDYRISIAGLDRYFKKFFTSGYVGAMKPDSAMYSLVFSPKSEIVAYIDDDEAYALAAQTGYGVRAQVYSSVNDLLQWIR